jgi:hypothetical protein
MGDSKESCFHIRKSQDHSSVASSSGLIAGSNVLRRLSTPRHPPFALIDLIMPTRPRPALISNRRSEISEAVAAPNTLMPGLCEPQQPDPSSPRQELKSSGSRSVVQTISYSVCCSPTVTERQRQPANDIHFHDLSKSDAYPSPIGSASIRSLATVWEWLTGPKTGSSKQSSRIPYSKNLSTSLEDQNHRF